MINLDFCLLGEEGSCFPGVWSWSAAQYLYVEMFEFFKCASFKVNYQFLKRNDDRIDIASDRINPDVSNDSLSLFDWTAHSLIFMAQYEPWKYDDSSSIYPSIRAWIKYGFNGKRALLAN